MVPAVMAEVTIATLNIFNNPHGRWSEREPVIAAQLAVLRPDACAFQEVDRAGSRVAAVVAQANRELGEERYAMHVMPNPSPTSIKSLAVATALPLLDRSGVDLDAGDIAFRVGLEADGTAFDLVTTHFLYRPTREGAGIRRRQADQLLNWLAAHDEDRPTVLVGDFNALPTGATIATIKGSFRSVYEVVHGTEADITHPTPFVHSLDAQAAFGVPELPRDRRDAIDYIFVSDAVTVVDASLAFDSPAVHDDTLYPSDHFGLVARLRV